MGHHHTEPTQEAKVKIGASLGAWRCDHKINSPSPGTQVKSAAQAPASWPLPTQPTPEGLGTDRPGHGPHRTSPDSGTSACHCWASVIILAPRRVGLCSPTWVPGTGRGRHPVLAQEDQRSQDPALERPADSLVPTRCGLLRMEPSPTRCPSSTLGLTPAETRHPSGCRLEAPPSQGSGRAKSASSAVRGSGPGGLSPAAAGGRCLGRWWRHWQVGWLRGDRVTSCRTDTRSRLGPAAAITGSVAQQPAHHPSPAPLTGCRRGRAGSARRAQWNPRSGP